MRPLACAAFACLFTLMAAAQVPAPKPGKREPPPGTLTSVVIKGSRLYSSDDIIRDAGLKVGQRVSPPLIEQARRKLQDSELFNAVTDEYRTSGGAAPEYSLTIEVVENEQVFPMRFERLGVDPEAIRDYLKTHVELFADRIPGTEGVLRRYKEAIRQFVSQSNANIKVRAAISNDDPKELTVLFTPDAPAPAISQVTVSGNKAVDTGTILRAVNSVAIGSQVSETRLKMILDGAIKPVYAARGYAAVSFPKVEVVPSKNNLGVVVNVEIKDGPLFKFGPIRFRGKGLEEDEIRSAITFKAGQTFNSEQVDNFRIDLLHRMKRRGLLDADITYETSVDDAKHEVDLVYNVIPGEAYNFGTLDIRGLDMTSQPVIERLWGEKPGQPFNPDYPDFFLKKVQEQGLFDHLAETRSDYTADSTSHNVTVHLYFKGGKSATEKNKEKKDEEEKRKSDGTWSPYPQ